MSNNRLDPIYQSSFVGIWKRMFVSGRPQSALGLLIFNENGSCQGTIGAAKRKVNGNVIEVRPDQNNPNQGFILVQSAKQSLEWSYTLNQNHELKSEFRPLPKSNKQAPVFNELQLVGQGARHLYAFFSHPFKRVIREDEVLNLAP